MYDFIETWKTNTAQIINELLAESGIDTKINALEVIAEIPPNPQMGDLGIPMFSFAKMLRKGPPQIAQLAAVKLNNMLSSQETNAKAEAQGPYLNIKMDRALTANAILKDFFDPSKKAKQKESMAGKRVMIEFSSPNTNKPLHLGHLRNDVLGESISRIIKECGAEVYKVCIINDRGIHICKSMLPTKKIFRVKLPNQRE